MNNKGADQTAHMRSLICAFVVRKHRKQAFSAEAHIYCEHSKILNTFSSTVNNTNLLIGSLKKTLTRMLHKEQSGLGLQRLTAGFVRQLVLEILYLSHTLSILTIFVLFPFNMD